MKKRIICLAVVMLLSLTLAGCCLSHEWRDATCTAPKTCIKCEKTEGEALGHTWRDATCTSAKTCSVCKKTEGSALGHTWSDATCTSAKTCSTCNKIEGSPLSHNYTWTTTREPSYTSEGQKEGICKECGETATESIEAIVPEYHWNKPVNISEELQIGMYNDGTNYWIEIKAKTMNTSRIVTVLNYGIVDLGFDVDGFLEWGQHIINKATNYWESRGVTYAEMSGYGRNWVFYMDTRDNTPGIIGIKVNNLKEFTALVGIDVTN